MRVKYVRHIARISKPDAAPVLGELHEKPAHLIAGSAVPIASSGLNDDARAYQEPIGAWQRPGWYSAASMLSEGQVTQGGGADPKRRLTSQGNRVRLALLAA